MRIKLPQYGDIRVKTWFAFLPIAINNYIRWFERVTVEQRCEYINGHQKWVNLRFLKEEGDWF